MPADLTVRLNGTPVQIRLGENASEARRQAERAVAATAAVQDILGSIYGATFNGTATIDRRTATGAFGAGTLFLAWAVGIDEGTDADLAGKTIAAVTAQDLSIVADGTTIRLRLWSRPSGSAYLNSVPGSPDDELLQTVDYDVDDLGLAPGGSAADTVLVLATPINGSSIAGKVLLVDIEGRTAADARAGIGIGSAANPGGLPDRKKGFYRLDSGWGAIDDATPIVAWSIEEPVYFDAPANEARLVGVEGETAVNADAIVALNLRTSVGFLPIASRADTSAYGAGTLFLGWGVGIDIGTDALAAGKTITAITAPQLSIHATGAKVRLRMWQRPAGSPYLNSAPGSPDDELLDETIYSLADLGLTAGGDAVDAAMRLTNPIDGTALGSDVLLIDLQGLTAGDAQAGIGIGSAADPGGLPARKRGSYLLDSGWGAIDGSPLVAWEIDETEYLDGADTKARLDAAEAALGSLEPAPSDILLPDEVFLTEGLALPFFPRAMASERIEPSRLDISVESVKFLPGTAQADPPMPGFKANGPGPFAVDGSAVGDTIDFTLRRPAESDERFFKAVTATVTPWAAAGSPRILFVGDSLAAQFKPSALKGELVARGMTPVFLGTLASGTFDGTTAPGGEGRGGKAMADYLYQRVYSAGDVNTMKPCTGATAITFGAYQALPQTGGAGVDARENRNPFLVAGSGAGFYNGYKWSLGQYLTYTGEADPDFVFISLGTNDLFQFDSPDALATIETGIALMVSEIRAAAPDCVIVFIADGLGRRAGIDAAGEYYAAHHAMMQTQYAAVKALVTAGDTKLFWQPLALHQDANRFGALDTVSTDDYGLETVEDAVLAAGYVHPTGTNISTAAQAMASLVAALA